jgi:hypothetical protein
MKSSIIFSTQEEFSSLCFTTMIFSSVFENGEPKWFTGEQRDLAILSRHDESASDVRESVRREISNP